MKDVQQESKRETITEVLIPSLLYLTIFIPLTIVSIWLLQKGVYGIFWGLLGISSTVVWGFILYKFSFEKREVKKNG